MKLIETLEFTVSASSNESQAHGLEIENVSVQPNRLRVTGGSPQVLVAKDGPNIKVTNSSDAEVSVTVTVEHWFSAASSDVVKAYSKQVCINEGETEASAEQIATDNLADLQTQALDKWASVIENGEAADRTNAPWALVKPHLESWIIANLL